MLSLVPLVLALVQGSEREPIRPAGLLVRVVDAQGNPCPGVQVAMASPMGFSSGPPDAIFSAPRVTEPGSGSVRFADLVSVLGLSGQSKGFVRLGVPAETPIEAPL